MTKEEYPKERSVLNRTGEHHDAPAEYGKQGAERDAPGHMGLISENHPGMTAEIPACSTAPAAAAESSPLSRALLAAASASIPKP